MMLSTLFVSALLAGPVPLLTDAGYDPPVFADGNDAASPVLLQRLLRLPRQPLNVRQNDSDGQCWDVAACVPRTADRDWTQRFQASNGEVPRLRNRHALFDESPEVYGFHPQIVTETPDAVGSLGRVGNPFEVPVGMTQEEQGKPDYVLRTGAVFLSALTVAEIEVTRAVIERGGRELNALYKPFEKHPGALGLVNGAVTGGLGLIAVELNRRGKKTEARVFVWAMVAVKAVVFTHNVRQLRTSR